MADAEARDETPKAKAEATEEAAVLEAIRKSVAVVESGQMLIVRLDPDTDDEVVDAVAEQMAMTSSGTGVKMMLVVAPEIAVAVTIEDAATLPDD